MTSRSRLSPSSRYDERPGPSTSPHPDPKREREGGGGREREVEEELSNPNPNPDPDPDPDPDQGPCVLRYFDFKKGDPALVGSTFKKFFIKYWLTQAGSISMNAAKHAIDTATSDFEDNTKKKQQPIYLHKHNHKQKVAKGKWLASTLLRHCGSVAAGWLSCVNVAWHCMLDPGAGCKGGGAVRKPQFGYATAAKAQSESHKAEMATACAEAVGAASLSRCAATHRTSAPHAPRTSPKRLLVPSVQVALQLLSRRVRLDAVEQVPALGQHDQAASLCPQVGPPLSRGR